MVFDTYDFLTFMYPALYFVLGVIYVLCAKFSKPNFFIGYRNKLNRKDPTLWKISNFVSGILFLCFAFFHACVILALIAIKYICEVQGFTRGYLIFISEFMWVVELCLVAAFTNAFTRWTRDKLDLAAGKTPRPHPDNNVNVDDPSAENNPTDNNDPDGNNPDDNTDAGNDGKNDNDDDPDNAGNTNKADDDNKK